MSAPRVESLIDLASTGNIGFQQLLADTECAKDLLKALRQEREHIDTSARQYIDWAKELLAGLPTGPFNE